MRTIWALLEAVRLAFEVLEVAAAYIGLLINLSKTKSMYVNPKHDIQGRFVQLGSVRIEAVLGFVYSGFQVNSLNDIGHEIDRHILTVNRCFLALRSNHLSKRLEYTKLLFSLV